MYCDVGQELLVCTLHALEIGGFGNLRAQPCVGHIKHVHLQVRLQVVHHESHAGSQEPQRLQQRAVLLALVHIHLAPAVQTRATEMGEEGAPQPRGQQ